MAGDCMLFARLLSVTQQLYFDHQILFNTTQPCLQYKKYNMPVLLNVLHHKPFFIHDHSLFIIPYSVFLILHSLFLILHPIFLIPYSSLPTPYSLLPYYPFCLISNEDEAPWGRSWDEESESETTSRAPSNDSSCYSIWKETMLP